MHCLVLRKTKQQYLFKELMKMILEYAEGIPGEVDQYFKKNKRNLIMLDDLMDEASKSLNPLSANFTKWLNTLKQFVGNLPTNCLSVFDHFLELALPGLKLRNCLHMAVVTIFP